MNQVARMKFKKETKGAVQFEEVTLDGGKVSAEQALMGGCYVRKSALGGTIPQHIHVTVETIED